MQELVLQVKTALRGMWKYRWLGVASAWVVALVGSAAVFSIPDRYQANARIHVDTQSILKPLLAGLAVQPNVDQQIAILSRTLISRPNVEKLVRMADLDLKSASKAEQDAQVERLMQSLMISGTGSDNLYVLGYRDTDPARALRAVQSLVSIFVESGLGASRKDSDSARVFIDEQIKSYQAKLEEAESRLKAFKLRNIDSQVGDGRDITTRINEIATQLEKAKLEMREAENARDAARAALVSEKGQVSTLSTQSLVQEASSVAVVTPEVDARIDAQRRNLDGLLQRFTDLHPEVIATRRLIKDLEEQKAQEMQALRKVAAAKQPAPAAEPGASPAIQELNRMVAMSEVQVAALKARVAEYANRYAQARAMLKTAPQLEAEAAQLNRDYAVHKKNYEDLVARRESAAISGDVEVASGVADFRVIEPPRVSPQPVWPNRKSLMLLVLLASVAAGAALAFVASQLRPVFFDLSELKSRLQLPVLGAVSALPNAATLRRQRVDRFGFVTATASLVAVFAVGLALMSIQQVR